MRYFIVSYNYKDAISGFGSGCLHLTATRYPPMLEIESSVKFDNIVILNIIELTREDYESFVSVQTNKG